MHGHGSWKEGHSHGRKRERVNNEDDSSAPNQLFRHDPQQAKREGDRDRDPAGSTRRVAGHRSSERDERGRDVRGIADRSLRRDGGCIRDDRIRGDKLTEDSHIAPALLEPYSVGTFDWEVRHPLLVGFRETHWTNNKCRKILLACAFRRTKHIACLLTS